MIRVGSAVALGAGVWLYATPIVIGLSMCALLLAGFIVWHVFEPQRTRAHTRYRARISSRPRPATEWAAEDTLPPLPAEPASRTDIEARPGRRMIALLDPDPADIASST